MVNPLTQLFNIPEGLFRTLSWVGISVHWTILQYSIGLFTLTLIFEIMARVMKNKNYLEISKILSKVAVVIFAVGAATGSLGEFGLVLFWPNFMELVGQYFFAPFYLELFAFFAEVVFVYMYYYTWKRIGPKFHIFIGVLVVIGLFLSSLLIISANTLMAFPPGIQPTYNPTTGQWSEPSFNLNLPEGGMQTFNSSQIRNLMHSNPSRYNAIIGATLKAEGVYGIVFQIPGAFTSSLHAILAAILVTIFTIIGVYSYRYLRVKEDRKEYYTEGLKALAILGIVVMGIQAFVGHLMASDVSIYDPEKLAAMEGTSATVISVGKIPLIGPLIDKFVTFLAYGNFNDHLPNYDNIPSNYQAPIIIHYFYYLKLFLIGLIILDNLVFLLYFFYRKHMPPQWFLKINYISPLIIQSVSNLGWITRELGRKPWTLYGMITVDEAARSTPVPIFIVFGVILYVLIIGGSLLFIVYYLFRLKEIEEPKIEIEREEIIIEGEGQYEVDLKVER